jgi:hypothetical protein
LPIATIKDGKVIRSGCMKLFMDSNENDLKKWVDTTILGDTCSHIIELVSFAENIPYVNGATMECCTCR